VTQRSSWQKIASRDKSFQVRSETAWLVFAGHDRKAIRDRFEIAMPIDGYPHGGSLRTGLRLYANSKPRSQTRAQLRDNEQIKGHEPSWTDVRSAALIITFAAKSPLGGLCFDAP